LLQGCDSFIVGNSCTSARVWDVRREGEHEVVADAPASSVRQLGQPAAFDAGADGTDDGAPMHVNFGCERVVAGIALPVLITVCANRDEDEPMRGVQFVVLEDTTDPVEASEAHDCPPARPSL
jgi:hypothetical protein